MAPLRVQLVDPPAFTPPYDRSLSAALAAEGLDVELVTSRFAYGPVPPAVGYEVSEPFYRTSARIGLDHPRLRQAARAAEHVPGMLAYRRRASNADLVHWQWLSIPRLDRHLLAPKRPRVYTMHWRLPPRASRLGSVLADLLARMDAVVSHTEDGRIRLVGEFGVPEDRLEVIPHGALDYLADQPDEQELPDELASVEGPVVLAFGLIRPYKGVDVLLEAFQGIEGAELWVVGMPMVPMEPLREQASRCRSRVRFVDRFVSDREIPAFMRRADLVVLPYREIQQSGVLYAALAFGKPLLLTDVGGFPEVAAHGAARLVAPSDPAALAAALGDLIEAPDELARLAEASEAAARGPYSWSEAATRTKALYDRLLGQAAGR